MRLAFYNCSLWTTPEIWKKKSYTTYLENTALETSQACPFTISSKNEIQTSFYLQVTHLKWLQLLQILSAITGFVKKVKQRFEISKP